MNTENIQKDREAESIVLQRLYQDFQEEMRRIEEEQQKILLDMINRKQDHE
jgi:hypothetical protein